MNSYRRVSQSHFEKLSFIKHIKGAKLAYSRFIKSHLDYYFEGVDGAKEASIETIETVNSKGQRVSRSLDLVEAYRAIGLSKSISHEDLVRVASALWAAIEATDLLLDAPAVVEEIVAVEEIPAVETPVVETVVEEAPVAQEEIPAEETAVVNETPVVETENVNETAQEITAQDTVETAILETVIFDEITEDEITEEDIVEEILLEETEVEITVPFVKAEEAIAQEDDLEETFEEILEEDIVEEIVITAENFEQVITAEIAKAEIKTYEEKATETAELDRIEDLIEDAWGLSGVPNQNHILSGLEQRLNKNYYMRTRYKEDAELEALKEACRQIQIANDLKMAKAIAEAAKEEEAREAAEREEIQRKQREDYLREQAALKAALEETQETAQKTLESTAEDATINTHAQTPAQNAEETEMLSIKYSKTQKDIIETLTENFDLGGEVVMLSTKMNFDSAFGRALKARLERLVNMNRRSINTILGKLEEALVDAPEMPMENTPPGGAIFETQNSEVSENARLPEQTVSDSINPVEKPMNKTELDEWDDYALVAEQQQVVEDDRFTLGQGLQETIREKQLAREQRQELPKDHWSYRKTGERRTSVFISGNTNNEETKQPIPEPVDFEDIW